MSWVKYVNGNYTVFLNTENGTKIRYNNKEYFVSDRPESMDVKISNDCEHNCSYCHEASYFGGKLADPKDVEQFASTLPPFVEIALGGGNLLKNIKHTQTCLETFKKYNAIVSITINQKDFVNNIQIIDDWYNNNLIHGIGVSLIDVSDSKFWNQYYHHKTCVIHTIAGLLTSGDIAGLIEHHARVLILGYKTVRKGQQFFSHFESYIKNNMTRLNDALPYLLDKCEVCSFDNLALKQLHVQDYIEPDVWNTYYMGDDGTTTFYVDLVSMEYAKSSSSLERYSIDNIDCSVMFNFIRDKEMN